MELLIEKIDQIVKRELNQSLISAQEIVGMGTVNRVFEIKCNSGTFIIKLNEDPDRRSEFAKEKWCLESVTALGIPSPQVLGLGDEGGYSYILQTKIEGVNGSLGDKKDRFLIWQYLGRYLKSYSDISKMHIPQIPQVEFHENWPGKLNYNLLQLNADDSLLAHHIFTVQEHQKIRQMLRSLISKCPRVGLVHGDLSPRNTIFDGSKVYLLDWGTAGIDIVPDTELGIVINEGEADEEEVEQFMEGIGLTKVEQKAVGEKIGKIHLLNRLDKYRWASDHEVEDLSDYERRLRQAYENVLH